MRLEKYLLTCIVFISATATGYSQTCTTLGQNPGTAFPVCGTTSFSQTTVPPCGGAPIPGPCGASAGLTDLNPFWYRFTCYVTGSLGFQIKPNVLTDDYDWQLFDITGHNPSDVYTDATLFVACNWSGFSGVTGASAAGTSLINCAGNVPIFSSMPTITAGHEYILLISHYTSTGQSGYTLSFTGGNAVITDPNAPTPKFSDASINCDGTQIKVRFNTKLKCSSLAANGSDFTITPAATIASVSGFGCTAGFEMDSVLITLSAPLAPGNYTVNAATGSDANTLLDNCDREVAVGDNASFTFAPLAPLPMGTVTPPPCAPTSLTLTFTDPVQCASVAANGSDFTITGPSTVTISSATAVNCNANGETNTITLQLSAAILTGGAYQVNAATGSDGNTLIGQCSRQLTAGSSAPFTVPTQTPIAMGTFAQPGCAPTSVVISFAEPIKCNSIAANGSDFTISGPSNPTIISATPVSCNGSGEATAITIQFSAPILVAGTYNVAAATGSDGNTLLGNCGRQVNAGDVSSFTLAAQAPIAMGTIPAPPCTPQSITLNFTDPIFCNSIAANGSDFTINGPSAVTIISATPVNCNGSGQTNSITVQFSAPVTVSGTYNVAAATGSDGNTLLGDCGRQVNAGDVSSFTLAAQAPIAMGTIPAPPCTPQSITLNFADPIFCNSIAANGSDFTINGPSAVTIISATPVNCNGSGQTNSITLQFSAPVIVSGTYNVAAAVGSDGNTLVGDCGRLVNAGDVSSFTLAAQAPIAMGTIPQPPCLPQSVTLNFADPVFCSSIAANGSDFTVTGPAAVTIVSATFTCNPSGQTNTITLQFSAPVATAGTYNVAAATGSDGNTLIGDCGRQLTAGAVTPFTLAAQAPIPMGTIPAPPCLPQTITINFTDPILCNSIAANGTDFVITGPAAVTIASATPVNCNASGETNSITLQFSAAVTTPGSYNVAVATGSDGNTLLGNCGRQVNAGSTASFALAAQPPIAMATITPPPCIPQTITLNFATPILCSSIAANGTDFLITGPAAVAISSATPVNCNGSGEANSITLQLTQPILATGNFQVQVVAGSDGNTLLGQCGAQVTAGSNATFNLAAQPPLPMGTIAQPSCSPASLTLNFADAINCSSIAADGSDFIITGPSPVTISSATGSCTNGTTNAITIQLSAPVTVGGAYQLQIKNGSDANTLTGDCNRSVTVGDMAGFTIPVVPPVPMDSLTAVACSPQTLKLVFSGPIRCSSIAANGSDFILSGPAAPAISSATGTCDANGLTTRIDILLASPIVVGGTYQLQLTTGSDGNTLLSDCNRPTPAATLSFIAADTVSAEFQYSIIYDCQTDQIDFSHDGQHNVNSWNWTINNTAASSAQSFSQNFSAASQNTVQLTVSNGVCSDVFSTTIVLNNKVTVDFDAPESICPEDTAFFINKSSGPIDTWQWQFGNSNTSNVQTPPGQIYPTTGVESLYTVSLTVDNAAGCQSTATKVIKVLSACIIAVPSAFTPNNDGLNDYLFPLNALKAEKLDFKVFNRWGQMVFHSTDWRQKWDGKINGVLQATSVYVWTLTFTYKDTGQQVTMRGTTTLIR